MTDFVTPSPAHVTLRAPGDCRKGRDIWLSLQNRLGDKEAFIPHGLRGQPLKPEQRRFDTHFHFNNPCHWTSPGISLFLQSLEPQNPLGTLVSSMQAAHANLCPFVGQYGWQVPADAFHPTGLRQEAAGPGGTSPGEGSAGASRWAESLWRLQQSRCSHQTEKKTPKKPPRICQHARDQVVLCRRRFSSCIALLCSGGCCPGIPLEEPQIAGRHGGVCRREQRAVSIKGKSSLLVCAPADSQRVLLCLSAVTSAFLSPTYPGARSQPPRRAGAPPQRSQGRLERREQQHFQDEQECVPRRAVLASSLILYS